MHTRRARWLLSLGAAWVVLFVCDGVRAEQVLLPGSQCDVASGHYTGFQKYRGWFTSYTAEPITVNCPIPNPFPTAGARIANATMTVSVKNAPHGFPAQACGLYIESLEGGPSSSFGVYFPTANIELGLAGEERFGHWSSKMVWAADDWGYVMPDEAALYIECEIGPEDRIFNYQIEFDGAGH